MPTKTKQVRKTRKHTGKPLRKSTPRIPVVVTTEKKGVFFGYATSLKLSSSKEIVIQKARMCFSWCAAVKGVVGLAATGPLAGSKVTLAAEAILLTEVTAVMQCSPEAAECWEKAIWG